MSAENDLQAAADAARNYASAANDAADVQKKLAREQEQLTAQLRASFQGLSRLGGQLGRGTADLESFNGMLELTSVATSSLLTGIKQWSNGLSAAGGKLGALGKILGLTAGAANTLNKATLTSARFLTERLNTSYKTFQQFGSIGALGADGIEGLLDQSINAKIGLEAYGKVVMNNAETLARFGGTTASGAQKFSELIADLTDPAKTAGDELRKLGLGGEDIANWAATYIASEQRMGRARAQTTEQLTQGTINYVKELDELSRLTGTSKEALEKQRQAAETDQAYRATLYKMEQEGNVEGAERLRKTISAIGAAFGPEYQRAAMAQASGLTSNEYAMAGMTSTGGKLADILNNLVGPGGNVAEALQSLQGAVKENLGTMADYTQATHNQGGVMLNFVESMNGASMDLSKIGQPIKNEQNAAAKTQNELTNNVITATKNMQELSVQMATLTKYALPSAAIAVKTLGTAAAATAAYLMSIGGRPSPTSGGGAAATTAPGPNTTPGGAATGQVPLGGQIRPRPGILDKLGPDALQQLNVSSQGERGQYDPRLIGLAKNLQDMYPNITFTGINDRDDGAHGRGEALDFTLPGMTVGDVEQGRSMVESLRNMGFRFALDEYNNPSPKATGPHFHAQLATGGIVSGPKSGYGAMLHGTEAVVPLPDGRSIPVQTNDSGNFELQLDRLDTIISVMRDQVSATQKLLQYAS